MPILKKPNADDLLDQGDILQGLRLYSTGKDWEAEGGSPEWAEPYKYSVVISRPCVGLHKTKIIVAAIDSVSEKVSSKLTTFKLVREFLEGLRDGIGQPDRFYLGQIPGADSGRYYIQMDSFHTIVLPDAPNLKEFLKSHRVAKITSTLASAIEHPALQSAVSPMWHFIQTFSSAELS